MKQTQAKQLLSWVTIIATLYLMPFASWANYNSARKMQVNGEWPSSAGDDCGTTGLDLTGDGQLITTCDTGIDTGNMETMTLDIKANLVGFAHTYSYVSRTDINGHGTHTAGSIVGTGANSNGKYKGMAYEAKLWAWMGGDSGGSSSSYVPNTVNEAFRPTDQSSYADCGMVSHIYSASYGTIGNSTSGYVYGQYTESTKSIDEYCWNNPDFLPVWAAANSGQSGATTISTQSASKNALVVGATGDGHTAYGSQGDENMIAYFSSLGPTKDGRIKPDVVAPGTWIASVRSTQTTKTAWGICTDYTSYMYDSGTSQATPLTAGVCALVREWLVKYRGFNDLDKKPSSALMKAVLMGGAIDINADKNAQGAGRVNLRSSIAPEDGCEVYLKDRIPFAEGSKTIFTFTTTEDKPLDAQLVWVDYPGDYTADQSVTKLINNLDLVLYDDTGKRLAYGNGGSEPDKLNNAEAIHQTSLPAGTYKLFVNSENIPQDSAKGGAAAIYLKGAFDASDVKVRSANQPIRIIVR